jgi:hypothetical protein
MKFKRLFSPFFWKYDVWYSLCAWFNPRQKWLTKHIKNTWQDKPELIKDILFASLVHYVEEENGIQDHTVYDEDLKAGYISQEYYDSVVTTNTELQEVYNYIKHERSILEKVAGEALNGDDLGDWFTKESVINDKDVWAMTTIAKYSPYLWT